MIRAALAALLLGAVPAGALDLDRPDGTIRVATFNAALSRRGAGMLIRDLTEGSGQVAAVVEIILRVRPDILLLNEFDRDPSGRAMALLTERLGAGMEGLKGIDFPFVHAGPVNTGLRSGFDLDGDGRKGGPGDAYGYGRFPGQYGMALLSRFPIETAALRSFMEFPWSAMPGALRPPGIADETWAGLRLSSKSHWDVPVRLPGGRLLHILSSHPTPPVFDGPEDMNGRRNHDEIRFWSEYVDGAGWIVDDAGRSGGLAPDTSFVFLGDLNSDPVDGDSRHEAIAALLAHPLVQDPRPASPGAVEAAAAGEASAAHKGDPALDTGNWSEQGAGNLRVDYVLPSAKMDIVGAGVFWPSEADPLARLTAGGRRPASSDHHLVWVDLMEPAAE